jgi:hypothetical protein
MTKTEDLSPKYAVSVRPDNRFYRTREGHADNRDADPVFTFSYYDKDGVLHERPATLEPPDLGDVVRWVKAVGKLDHFYARLAEWVHKQTEQAMALPDVDLLKTSPGYRRFVEECVLAMMQIPKNEWPSWLQCKEGALKPAAKRPTVYYKTFSDPLTGRRTSVPKIEYE